MKYGIGSIHKTKLCGDVTVLANTDAPYKPKDGRTRYPWVIIAFDDGIEMMVNKSNLSKGAIYHPNYPKLYNRGFCGVGSHQQTLNNKPSREYILWANMLKRCYSKTTYKTYFGCEVDSSWFNFQVFCEDIKHLEGFDLWLNDKSIDLDKDKLSKDNKIYSRDTCVFISHKENSILGSSTGKTYVATRLRDGYREEFSVFSLFAEKYNLNQSHLGGCAKGYRKAHKGWVVEVKVIID